MSMKVILIGVCLGGFTAGPPVRVVDQHRYEILDTAGFYLYSLRKLVQGEKISRVETVYYFSIDDSAPVRELTLANLEEAFASNACFRYHLEAQFHSDKALMAYDKYLGMYKIKWLYGLCRRE